MAGLKAAGLTDIEVTSRVEYDHDQLCSLGKDEVGADIDPSRLGEAKVTSIRVTGKRP